jgi:hypothetical protein
VVGARSSIVSRESKLIEHSLVSLTLVNPSKGTETSVEEPVTGLVPYTLIWTSLALRSQDFRFCDHLALRGVIVRPFFAFCTLEWPFQVDFCLGITTMTYTNFGPVRPTDILAVPSRYLVYLV